MTAGPSHDERDMRFGLTVVVAGLVIGFAGILYAHLTQLADDVTELDTGAGEAFAALAGAIVGSGGTEIGRATGVRRRGGTRMHRDHVRVDAVLVVVAVAAVGAALGLIAMDRDWAAAAVTLAVAAAGIPAVHLSHERTRLDRRIDLVTGQVLVVGVPVAAIVAFLSFGYAEAVAAVAVALLGVGATLMSHGRGARTGPGTGAAVRVRHGDSGDGG
ncbi:hypothetical protein [Actinoplanes sp. NPDC023714]|uniref:hypothetical protein n=1 Tax=Actinoplanes sp. NPDC023714 TaxID=3154322 RepID=UPI0033D17469